MASARKPLPPIVVIDHHPDQPISPRQRAAWWRVAADLQRLARQKIAQEMAQERATTPVPEEASKAGTPPVARDWRTAPPTRAELRRMQKLASPPDARGNRERRGTQRRKKQDRCSEEN
jgi:hypothetical protein